MAIKYENFASDTLMSFGKSFSRLNGQPLDKSSIWYNLNDAKAYVATGAAYIGQQLAVINTVGEGDEATTTVDCYVIKDEAGNLTQLSASEIGEELAAAIADLDDRIDNLELYTLDKYDSKSNTVGVTFATRDEDGEIVRGSLDVKIATNDGNLVKQGVIETDLGGDVGIQNIPGGLFVDPRDIKDLAKEQIIDSLSDESPINGILYEDETFKFDLRTRTGDSSYLDIDDSYYLTVPRPPIIDDVQTTIKGQKAIEVTKTDILAILENGTETGINELHVGLKIKDGETVLKQDDNGLYTDLDNYALKTDLDSKANKSVVDTLSETVNTNYQNLSGLISQEAETARAAEQANAKAASNAQATANDAKGKIDAFLDAENIGDATIDTLKEIQTYIETDGAAADQMVKDIADNKTAIEEEVTRATGVETGLDTRLTEAEGDIDDLEAFATTGLSIKGTISAIDAAPAEYKKGDVYIANFDGHTWDGLFIQKGYLLVSKENSSEGNTNTTIMQQHWHIIPDLSHVVITKGGMSGEPGTIPFYVTYSTDDGITSKNLVISSGKTFGTDTLNSEGYTDTEGNKSYSANIVATEAAVVNYVDTQISTQVNNALTWGTI